MGGSTPATFLGCYAKKLGNCDGRSNEHLISKSILETIGLFEVEGLPWIPPGEKRALPATALTASVLCRNHNAKLSKFDAEANAFFKHLKLIDGMETPEELQQVVPVEVIDGIKLEKWLLKTLCGVLASGNFQLEGKGFGKLQVTDHLVDLLFSERKWKSGLGLYVQVKDRAQVNAWRGIGYHLVTARKGTHAEVVGIDVEFWGFPLRCMFASKMGEPVSPGYRPRGLRFANGAVSRELKLTWPKSSLTTGAPTFTRTGTSRPPP